MNIEKLIHLFQNTHNELQSRVARSVDAYLVVRNWLFGWYIVEFENGGAERAELYGKRLIDILSESLSTLGIKGMSPTNLRKFREFYQNYKIQQALPVISPNANQKIQQALPAELDKFPETMQNTIEYLSSRFVLGWTHYVTLMTVKNDEERRFYEIEAAKNGWGYRELERQINSALFERLVLSRDKNGVKELSIKGQIVEKPADIIKNPYILEFTGLEPQKKYTEHELETAIIDKLELFILELGKGFLFESRQKRFSFDNRHFFVDLVFYNRLLKCFVVIDLKIGDLKHQDLGQMQMYVNYFDRYVKTEEENPTVGILLCLTKSDSLVELTLPKDSNIYASNYQLYLPSKEELKKQIEEAEKEFEKYVVTEKTEE
ncbi:MAG: PDDEXK nuclease domain-containing protein [bacterium]|jgi:predicted nuclease of restriction endonuclease-like (RecB) superfamily|nr:PDDEXK nuclease domain-containing protein [bacterium]